MFSRESRYAAIEVVHEPLEDGTERAYIRRRFLPPIPEDAFEIPVQQGDRIDLVAVRVAGDPLQFWRICDANETLHPFDLVREPGRTVRVPKPGGLP